MSGALDSVIGGVMGGSSGGSLLGDIGGLLGSEFGPIGSMIGEALGNMLQQAIQGAMTQATQNLQQQGMPSYVAGMVNDAVGAQTAQNTNHNVPADVQQQAQDLHGAQFDDFQNQLGAYITSNALANHDKASGKAGHASGGGSGSSASAGAGGGWLMAIAEAMGQALGTQAKNLVDLSNTLSSEVQSGDGSSGGAKAGAGSTGGAAGGAGGAPATSGATKGQAGDQSNSAQAQKFNLDMTRFQAQSQQYSILQNTFTNAIQAIGSALQGMARKG